MSVRFLPAGDTGLVVEFGSSVDRALSNRVLALSESLEAANIAGVVELVPTFRSLLIHYDPRLTSGASLEDGLRSRIAQHGGSGRHGRLWHVPACYDKKYAPDIAEVAERAGLTIAEVTERHSATQYHVYMIGFVPGLPYMGDTVPELNLPRRVNPRVRVPPGSIAIAIGQTIIYPVESPGRLASDRFDADFAVRSEQAAARTVRTGRCGQVRILVGRGLRSRQPRCCSGSL
jgi:inhibitor of KinA